MNKMERIKKVTQKKLCEIAKNLGAIRLTRYNNCYYKNCYYYEAYLSDTNKLINMLDLDVKRDEWGRYLITKWQLYYSCGLYGNTGQLHYIQYMNNYGVQCSCYVYYTNINYNGD